MSFLNKSEEYKLVYADNAATTKLDNEAFETMKRFLLDEYGNPSQPYSFSRDCKKAISEARKIIASCIGAKPEEIFFTSGGTESDNWAIKMGAGNKGDIITSIIEHKAILNSCQFMKDNGRNIIFLPVDESGTVDVAYLEKHMNNNVSLVSVMLANNEIGSIQPIKEIADIVHKYNCIFHTDAVQAVGHIPIDVKELGVDLLSASAHKFNGPRGIGFLYIKEGVDIAPLINGGSQESGKRGGTENVASIVGMAVALKKNYDTLEENNQHLMNLESELLDYLVQKKIQFIRNGSVNHLPGNISLSIKNSNGEMLLHRLDLMGICISTGSACDSKNTQISHVIKAINVPEEYAVGTIRISIGKENTSGEIHHIVEALSGILNKN